MVRPPRRLAESHAIASDGDILQRHRDPQSAVKKRKRTDSEPSALPPSSNGERHTRQQTPLRVTSSSELDGMVNATGIEEDTEAELEDEVVSEVATAAVPSSVAGDSPNIALPSFRRPQTTNPTHFWYSSEQKWATLLQDFRSDDKHTSNVAVKMLRKLDAAGRIMETDEGRPAPHPCTACTRRASGTPCRVWLHRDEKSCAFCKRYQKTGCTALSGTSHLAGEDTRYSTIKADVASLQVKTASYDESFLATDRKLCDLDEHLTAVRSQLRDCGERLTAIERESCGHDERLTVVDNKLSDHDKRLAANNDKCRILDERLAAYADRLLEAQNTWHAQLDRIEKRLDTGLQYSQRQSEQWQIFAERLLGMIGTQQHKETQSNETVRAS